MEKGHLDDLEYAAVAERLSDISKAKTKPEKAEAMRRLAEYVLDWQEVARHLKFCEKCMKEVLDVAQDLEEMEEAIKNMTPEQHAECDKMAESAKKKIFDLLWLDRRLREFN